MANLGGRLVQRRWLLRLQLPRLPLASSTSMVRDMGRHNTLLRMQLPPAIRLLRRLHHCLETTPEGRLRCSQ